MLVVDPTRRITFSQIRKHSWFRKDLPEYLAGPLRSPHSKREDFDQAIVQQLVDIGMTVEDRDNLTSEQQVAYHLLSDTASKQSSFTNLLRDDTHARNATKLYTDAEISKIAQLFDQEGSAPLCKLMPIQDERRVIISQVPAASECPWQLGVEVVMEAALLITEVLVTLRKCGYEWSQLTPWRVKARPLMRNENQFSFVLTVQVYKLAAGRYLIDTMVSQGPTLPALHAALDLLRCFAESDVIAPNIVEKSAGGLLPGHVRGR
jgi:hypothetical protein